MSAMNTAARPRLLILAAALGLPAAPALAAMQPGLWELTMTVTVDGKPQTVPAARECISQKDIDDGERTLPRPDGQCKLSNVKRTPDRATYDLACTKDALTTRGRAEIVFAAESYEGRVNVTVLDKNNLGVPIAMALNARRVGSCEK
jgi:hypothetical protein